MAQALVSIVMGSASDWPIMQGAAELLDQFEIAYEVTISSAHRAPQRTAALARQAADRGIQVIIAGAGGAAQMIALGDAQVAVRLRQYKADLAARVARDSEALQQQLLQGRA